MNATGSVERALDLLEASNVFRGNPQVLDAALAARDAGTSFYRLPTDVRVATNLLNKLARYGIDAQMVQAMVRYDLDEDVVVLAIDGGLTGAEALELLASGGTIDPATIRFLAAMRN